MDEDNEMKTRHTRQLLEQLHRISGCGARYDIAQQKATTVSPEQTAIAISKTLSNIRKDSIRQILRSDALLTAQLSERLLKRKILQGLQGLECLRDIDCLFITQEQDVLELTDGNEAEIKHVVQNADGDRLLFGIEQSTIFAKLCLCSRRPFKVLIFNNNNRHVMNIHRQYKVCRQKVTVYVPPEISIGTIKQKFTCKGSLFVIKNEKGETVHILKGAMCAFAPCRQHNFVILSRDGHTKLGIISNDWETQSDIYIDSQYLGVGFPGDLDLKTKALLLGATFLLTIIIHEQ